MYHLISGRAITEVVESTFKESYSLCSEYKATYRVKILPTSLNFVVAKS